MRKSISAIVVSAALVATPVAALGLGDLAKVVLGGKSVLKKGAQKCGSSLALTPSDNLTIDTAMMAVKKFLPATQFTALDTAAEADAANQAKAVTFCDETKVKKPGILGSIGKAGKSILKGGLGGLKI
jgi:hypothetical protein